MEELRVSFYRCGYCRTAFFDLSIH